MGTPFTALVITSFCVTPCLAKLVSVSNSTELKRITENAQAGDEIILAPGQYRGGITLKKLNGTQGTEALHLSDCSCLVLRNIHVNGYPGNGINIDDGGGYDTPTHHILLENVTTQDSRLKNIGARAYKAGK